MQQQDTKSFRLGQTFRLSTFQIGSAVGEILTASVWNRVMIADLGLPATPVGFLLALQYLLIPVSLWAGHRSDTTSLWGKRRTSYIWLGRGSMVVALPLLGLSMRWFEMGQSTIGWVLATAAFLLFGAGKLLSGSVYLALVRESVPTSKQGLAIGMAETMLIGFFPIAAVAFGRWMEVYDSRVFWQMILVTAVVGAFFWWFAVVRVEASPVVPDRMAERDGPDLVKKSHQIWQDARVRRFFIFLSVATFAAWMQDNVLEPFGAEVFALEAGQTTRFSGVWGGATILTLLLLFVVGRRSRPSQQAGMARMGLAIMAAGMLALAVVGLSHQVSWLTPALLLFGFGFGLYTFGGLSLMAVMSPDRDSGAYLGLWTISVLLFKGLGTLTGGILRDLALLGLGWSPAMSYGLIFVLAGIGLLASTLILNGRDVVAFANDSGRFLGRRSPQVMVAD